MQPGEQAHGLGINKNKTDWQTRTTFQRFWVKKEPRHSETETAEKCYLYRRTRLSVAQSGFLVWERLCLHFSRCSGLEFSDFGVTLDLALILPVLLV